MSMIMLVLRLYIATLSLVLCGLIAATRGLGFLEGAVIAGPILFMILDIHVEGNELRKLEKQVTHYIASI